MDDVEFVSRLAQEIKATPSLYAEGSQMYEHVMRGALGESDAVNLKRRIAKMFSADFERLAASSVALTPAAAPEGSNKPADDPKAPDDPKAEHPAAPAQ